MTTPLKKKEKVRVEHVCANSSYIMRSTDVYTDYYGMGYIISGVRKFITSNGIYFIHPGHINFVNIGLYHRTAPLSNQSYERYGLQFSYDAVKDLVAVIGESTFEALMSHIICNVSVDNQRLICNQFKEMYEEYERNTTETQLLLVGMLHRLLITILRCRQSNLSEANIPKVKDELIMKAIFYIDNHIYENPTANDIAQLVGLSYSQFSKRFRQAIGSTYSTYLNHMKILYSQMLLTHTKDSIEKIAQNLSFCNSNYYCNVFHKYTGISPTEYRKNNT